MARARRQFLKMGVDQLDDYWHASRRWVYNVHLNPWRKLVDETPACLGLARKAGITLMIPERQLDRRFVVLPKGWVNT